MKCSKCGAELRRTRGDWMDPPLCYECQPRTANGSPDVGSVTAARCPRCGGPSNAGYCIPCDRAKRERGELAPEQLRAELHQEQQARLLVAIGRGVAQLLGGSVSLRERNEKQLATSLEQLHQAAHAGTIAPELYELLNGILRPLVAHAQSQREGEETVLSALERELGDGPTKEVQVDVD